MDEKDPIVAISIKVPKSYHMRAKIASARSGRTLKSIFEEAIERLEAELERDAAKKAKVQS